MIKTVAPIAALLLSIAILLTGNGLQGTLIAVRASLEGFPTAQIGLLVAGYYAGFIAGALLAPRIIMRAGHIRAFAVLAAVATAGSLAHAMVVDPFVWIGLRVTIGFCFCGLYMVIESWLNERTVPATRGRTLSIYRIIDLSANTGGQLLLTLADPLGYPLFCATSILICLSLIPVSMTSSTAPKPIRTARIRLLKLYRISPLGLAGSFVVGLANGAFWGLAPVFVQTAGHPINVVAYFMSTAVVGGAILQWPIGYLSDRLDRRKVLIGGCFAASVAGAALALLSSVSVPILLPLAAIYGGLIMPLYSLCIAHTNDHVAPDGFVEASSGLLLVFGVGATVGPFLASSAMQELGGGILFAYTAGLHALLGLFGLYRTTRRPSVPSDLQSGFVAVPRTTPVMAELDPRQQSVPGDTVPTKADPSERAEN